MSLSTELLLPSATRRPEANWSARIPTDTRGATAIGLLATGAFAATFGLWAAFAPLSSAAVAHGYVAAAGRNIQLQHLEGGIVEEILVHEGDRVVAGQQLFRLNATAATAQRNRLTAQLFALEAKAERLEAERGGQKQLDFGRALRAGAADPAFARILEEQGGEFASKLEGQRRELAMLQQQIEALANQIAGFEEQRAATLEQVAIVEEEGVRKSGLFTKGLASKSEYNASRLSRSQLLGQIAALNAQTLTAQTQIAEKREQLARQESRRQEVASAELNETRTQIADLRQQLSAAEAVLQRVSVRTPNDGIVVKINYNAAGSVVAPGQSLAEILPTSDDLIVEARVTPQDVDAIHVRQPAELRFTSLNRLTPPANATVTFVSPDRLVDPRTEQPYFVARLRLEEPLPHGMVRSQVFPGMPVDAYIKTGSRTFFSYLFQPIADSFSRAFRESD